MSLTNPNTPISQKDLQDFYHKLLPYIGSSDGHTIEDNNGISLEQRDTLQFNEGFTIEDDNTNKKTIISSNVMQSGDINDIISQLPTIHAGREIILSDTLLAGETTITFTSEYITTSSIIDPYTDTYGINPLTVTVSAGQVVMTFDAQENDMLVGIGIK